MVDHPARRAPDLEVVEPKITRRTPRREFGQQRIDRNAPALRSATAAVTSGWLTAVAASTSQRPAIRRMTPGHLRGDCDDENSSTSAPSTARSPRDGAAQFLGKCLVEFLALLVQHNAETAVADRAGAAVKALGRGVADLAGDGDDMGQRLGFAAFRARSAPGPPSPAKRPPPGPVVPFRGRRIHDLLPLPSCLTSFDEECKVPHCREWNKSSMVVSALHRGG